MGGNKSKKFVFKHNQHHQLLTAVSSTTPSSASSGSTGANKTVQERLEQSRREAHRPRSSTEALQRAQHFNSLATAASKPLETRELLQIPETVPIRQRPTPNGSGSFARWRRGGDAARSGPAGPPPPRSWALAGSRFAPSGARLRLAEQSREASLSSSAAASHDDDNFDDGFGRITLLQEDRKLESHSLPRPRSLKYFALKSLANAWLPMRSEMISEDFEDLDTGMKSVLVAYLGHLRVPIRKEDLNLLFTERDAGDLQRLDFSGVAGNSLSIKDISRFLAKSKRNTQYPDIGERRFSSIEEASSLSFDTWEEAANLVETQVISRTVGGNAFLRLTHLSLAHSGPTATWSDLLELASKLHLLTHLSLAHWPTPLLRRDTHAQGPGTALHSSPFQSQHTADRRDWDESAYVLRALSKATYSLQWLDLEGCNSWLPALAVRAARVATSTTNNHVNNSTDTPQSTSPALPATPSSSSSSPSSDEESFWRDGIATQAKGPDWNGSWSKLKYINVAQPWFPANLAANKKMYPSLIRDQVCAYIEDQHRINQIVDYGDELDDIGSKHYKSRYDVWEAQEDKDRVVVKKIREQLKSFVVFDRGWQPVLPLTSGSHDVYPKRTNY